MLFSDYLNTTYNGKPLPDYYDFMYLDGYTPTEIWLASKKSLMAKIKQNQEIREIKITSEIKRK